MTRPLFLFVLGLLFLGITLWQVGVLFSRMSPPMDTSTASLSGNALQLAPSTQTATAPPTPTASPPGDIAAQMTQTATAAAIPSFTGTVTSGPLPQASATATPRPFVKLTRGSTVQHRVAAGEWLSQIVRCYGATFREVRNANPQIADPNLISPSMTLTIPNIGSAGPIGGPPCIAFHTVQPGDTWASIAETYNAGLALLQRVNPGSLTVGTTLTIPLHSGDDFGQGGPVGYPPPYNPPIVTPGAPAPTTPTESASAPVRITFDASPNDAGSNTASRIGIIKPNERVRYIVNAQPGQVLTIDLSAPSNEVTLVVNDPSGLALKSPDWMYPWSTVVTTGGDHTIELASPPGSPGKSYTLSVSLTSPSSLPETTPTNPAPDLLIEAEWPVKLEVGQEGTVRISLIQTDSDGYVPTVVVTGNTAEISTARAVGTPDVGIGSAFGPNLQAFAIPAFDTMIGHTPPEPEPQRFDGSRIDWKWIVAPTSKGRQTVIVSITIEWRRDDGTVQDRRKIWDPPQPIAIEVVQPFITMGELSISSLLTGVIGSALSVPFLYGMAKDRNKGIQEKPKRKARSG
jgi:LysM repeat protein